MYPSVPEGDLFRHVKVPRQQGTEILFANYNRCGRLRKLANEKKDVVTHEPGYVSDRDQLLAEFGGGDWTKGSSTLIMAGDPMRALQGHGMPLPTGISDSLADRA